MKYLTLLLLLIQAGTLTTVESVEISGVAESSISQALRDDIQKLAGLKYDQTAAENLIHQNPSLKKYPLLKQKIAALIKGAVVFN